MLARQLRHGISALLFVIMLMGFDSLARAVPETVIGAAPIPHNSALEALMEIDAVAKSSGVTERCRRRT